MKKIIMILLTMTFMLCACSKEADLEITTNYNNEKVGLVGNEETIIQEPETTLSPVINLEFDLTTEYQRETGDVENVFYIDDENVLWGYGKNQYGQLGNGSMDFDYHEEPVKIADNVIHVDYSQYGYLIYLTADYRLFGLGNAYSGVFPDICRFEDLGGLGTGGYVGTAVPYLIATDVLYAACGQSDIVYINTCNELWAVGVLWYLDYKKYYYNPEPVKILDDVVYVSGNWHNYVALKKDGSVWTWGHNMLGNCGISDELVISEPTKVMEGCIMVWTGDEKIDGVYDNKDWRNVNTIVEKADGTYWMCGENAGEEEKTVPYYYPEFKAKWSSEFVRIK